MRVGRAEVEADLYDVLGLPPWATEQDIRRARRRLALRWHPDRNRNDAAAEERMKLVNLAASVLLDPAARARYDRLRFPWTTPAVDAVATPAPEPASPRRPARPYRGPAARSRGGAPLSPALVALALALTAAVFGLVSLTGNVNPVGSAGYRVPAEPRHATMWAE